MHWCLSVRWSICHGYSLITFVEASNYLVLGSWGFPVRDISSLCAFGPGVGFCGACARPRPPPVLACAPPPPPAPGPGPRFPVLFCFAVLRNHSTRYASLTGFAAPPPLPSPGGFGLFCRSLCCWSAGPCKSSALVARRPKGFLGVRRAVPPLPLAGG